MALCCTTGLPSSENNYTENEREDEIANNDNDGGNTDSASDENHDMVLVDETLEEDVEEDARECFPLKILLLNQCSLVIFVKGWKMS